MSKHLPQWVLDYIFDHCNDKTVLSAQMLGFIDNALDKTKPKVTHYAQKKVLLSRLVKGYAKRCLETKQNHRKDAQKQFVQDLCYDESLFSYFLHQSVPYQASEVVLEMSRNEPSETRDLDVDYHGFPEGAKIALSVFLLYANTAAMGKAAGLSSNVMLMVNNVIDCSKLSSDPKTRAWLETLIKEIIPLAVYVGVNMATVEGTLSDVAIYAFVEYLFARGVQFGIGKIFEPASQFFKYAKNQIAFGFSLIGFKNMFPPMDWITQPLLKKCLKPEYVDILSQSFNLTDFANGVNRTELARAYRKYSFGTWQAGNPVNNTVTSIMNEFYVCMRNKPN